MNKKMNALLIGNIDPLIAKCIEDHGHEMLKIGYELSEGHKFQADFIIIDLSPQIKLEVLKKIVRRYEENIPLIIQISDKKITDAVSLIKWGLFDIIPLPTSEQNVFDILNNVYKTHERNQNEFDLLFDYFNQLLLAPAKATNNK